MQVMGTVAKMIHLVWRQGRRSHGHEVTYGLGTGRR